jgi:hypothetical protein
MLTPICGRGLLRVARWWLATTATGFLKGIQIMIIGGICFILGFFGGTYLTYSWCCNVIAALENEVRRQAELMESIDGSLWSAK